MYNIISDVLHAINPLLYLISMFLCFVFRRKRKGKGAKGRARSGGRAHQKGSKQQGKASQPSPITSSDLTNVPIAEDHQPEQIGQSDAPDGVTSPNNDRTEDKTPSTAGEEIESNEEHQIAKYSIDGFQ